jgi:uncharacterized membrane protein YdcZ (DUF606 family)
VGASRLSAPGGASGVIVGSPRGRVRWLVVAYLAVDTAADALAREPVEWCLIGGIGGVLVVICAIVAASGPVCASAVDVR